MCDPINYTFLNELIFIKNLVESKIDFLIN